MARGLLIQFWQRQPRKEVAGSRVRPPRRLTTRTTERLLDTPESRETGGLRVLRGGAVSVVAGGAGAAALVALASSPERPSAAGGPAVVAVDLLDGEDGLLRPVVVPAEALQVVHLGRAGRPRGPVILVRVGRRTAAAREHAGPVPGFQEPLDPRRHPVCAGAQVGA